MRGFEPGAQARDQKKIMAKKFIVKYRRFLIALIHLALIVLSYLISFYIRFEFSIPVFYVQAMLTTLPFIVLLKMAFFYRLGLFHSSLRYSSIFDLWQVLKANTYVSMSYALILFFISGRIVVPRSVMILDWLLCLGLTSGMRFVSRMFRELTVSSGELSQKKVLIIGAGQAGVMILREYKSNPQVNVNVVGFIDDDKTKRNMRINGIPVFGGREMIPELSERFSVEEIVIAIPSAKGETVRDILSYCQRPGIKIKIVPGFHKIISGELQVKPRDIEPEDLLGREVVEIDEKEISTYLRGRRVLVTGAGGSIGSELCRQIALFKPALIILYDHNENDVYFLMVELKTRCPDVKVKVAVGDIKDISLLKHVFTGYHPQVVFHAAAHKHVPLMEECPAAAVKNNIIGSRNLIYAAHHYKAERFVLISTDKAVNPTSIMGATKRLAEMIMQAKSKRSGTKFMAVRFGNVLGSAGSVVPLFKKQIEEGGPVTVTHPEVKRYFMSISEAVKLVLQAAALGEGGEIFILDMGEQMKVVDLARNLITLTGLIPGKDIDIVFSGLRPGEKLYEEMLHDLEKDEATRHNKIFITQPNNFNPRLLRGQIRDLDRLAARLEDNRIIKKLDQIVPFHSSREEQ